MIASTRETKTYSESAPQNLRVVNSARCLLVECLHYVWEELEKGEQDNLDYAQEGLNKYDKLAIMFGSLDLIPEVSISRLDLFANRLEKRIEDQLGDD